MNLRAVQHEIAGFQRANGPSYGSDTAVIVRLPDGTLREVDGIETGLSPTGERALIIQLR